MLSITYGKKEERKKERKKERKREGRKKRAQLGFIGARFGCLRLKRKEGEKEGRKERRKKEEARN